MTDNIEIWKDIEGYEGKYMVSNLGRVKSINYHRSGKERLLKLVEYSMGYLMVQLSKNGIVKSSSVHRLVATAFIPNPNNYPCVNHINEIKTDNRAENLEWCTVSYNTRYGTGIQRTLNTRNLNNRWNREKPVLQYTKSGEFITSYKSSNEAGRQCNIGSGGIRCVCCGKGKTYKGYIWKYAEEK